MGTLSYVADGLRGYFNWPTQLLLGSPIFGHAVAAEPATTWLEPPFPWLVSFLTGVSVTFLLTALLLRGSTRDQTRVFMERLHRVVRESSEYQQMSAELRESEERFRHLAENMRDIVCIATLDLGRTLFVNSAFEKATGRSKQSLYDRPNCLDLIHPNDRAEAVTVLLRQVLGNYERDAEFRIVRSDQSIRWLRCRAFSIFKTAEGSNQVGCVAEDITERRQAERELRQLSGRLLRLQDEERRRIARELHDSTGQALAGLLRNLSAVRKSAARLGKKAQDTLTESLELARQTSREVRNLAYLLHPPLLKGLGLIPSLLHYVGGYTRRSRIRVELNAPRNFGRLPPEIELAIFRVVQEGLTNIHRHSGSKTAQVRLNRRADAVRLEVQDQGRGMPPEILREGRILPGRGVGLAGMQERLRLLGGGMEIVSGSQGTTIKATIPIPNHQQFREPSLDW